MSTPNGPARFNRFQTGNIYHSPAGTDAVYGGIFGEWARQGYENGRLGFPISDEFDVPWPSHGFPTRLDRMERHYGATHHRVRRSRGSARIIGADPSPSARAALRPRGA
ncbi:LGFP repeat-containing protein [Nocardia abscessus]|uniref:LGFP repeat-containing protein n=1 Tax=Nocardia abscessus TaxID=120957 RepID=UPI001E61011E|nr:hypothetical protein [Nocardia abscessus]